MNTHKAHFQLLPVTSSGCDVKARIAAEVTEDVHGKLKRHISNKTLDFIIPSTASTLDRSPVLWFQVI